MEMTRRTCRLPVPQIQQPTLQDFDINVTASSFPNQNWPVQVFGGGLEARINSTFPGENYGTMYAWVHFTLNGLPKAPTGGIMLSLSPFGKPAPPASFQIAIYLMMQDWDPTTLTWNNQPAVPQTPPSWQSFWNMRGYPGFSGGSLSVFIPNPSAYKGLLFTIGGDQDLGVLID
jgi:hypothetical protein